VVGYYLPHTRSGSSVGSLTEVDICVGSNCHYEWGDEDGVKVELGVDGRHSEQSWVEALLDRQSTREQLLQLSDIPEDVRKGYSAAETMDELSEVGSRARAEVVHECEELCWRGETVVV
jgi:hypothetical protein